MNRAASGSPVRVAIIGAGKVSDYHHVPAIRLDPRATLVAACDASEELLRQRRSDWGIDYITTDYERICSDPNIDAVVIATPNFTHKPIAVAAALGAPRRLVYQRALALQNLALKDGR